MDIKQSDKRCLSQIIAKKHSCQYTIGKTKFDLAEATLCVVRPQNNPNGFPVGKTTNILEIPEYLGGTT
ncbi:uncharacterized protein METZ01_LOCUS446628 [marine metagenome]|uniref:Uncharacterized protein n=1 Tax=marine metagenome TaxID=408172 RepID=A0A382ZE23_9ZZZZ